MYQQESRITNALKSEASWRLAQWRLAQWRLAQWRLAQWRLFQWRLADLLVQRWG
jgi:hypothetical protein